MLKSWLGRSDGGWGRGQREESLGIVSITAASPGTCPVRVPAFFAKPRVHSTCFLGDDIKGLALDAGQAEVAFRYGRVDSLLIGWGTVWWLDSGCQLSVVWPSVICSQVFVSEREMQVFSFKGEVSGKPLWNKPSFLLLWTFKSNDAYFKATHISQSIHTCYFKRKKVLFF